MIGYKVFDPHWCCSGFQYGLGKEYEMDEQPLVSVKGFHFCETLIDCFNYYEFDPDNHVAVIEAYGDIDYKGTRFCTNKLRVERELSWEEVLRSVNIGKRNLGFGNTGEANAGNYNVGDTNLGHFNTGDGNFGDNNTGDHNGGRGNTGNHNLGIGNSGDWNLTSRSTGCFNTESSCIVMFDQPTAWTYSDWSASRAKELLDLMPISRSRWEKNEDPFDEETVLDRVGRPDQVAQRWYDRLPEEDREEIRKLPNFDEEKFFKITGVKA